ncbi:MAG: hypothetical protein GY809_12035, partial [Planctomycetes bacterium]|nr:hypothetical protein [Planctomycetota bacterium]
MLVDDVKGTVRDPQVSYDGETILFSYRPGGTDQFHLYQINRDGSGLKQLTHGIYDDFEPTYLPDGGIAFVSSRGKRWVNCWLTQVAILYRCDSDGSNIQPLSCNGEQDNTPWPLPDGRLLYMRWEYVDRSQVDYHHLWTMNPDGTGQMVFYGNMSPGTLMIDAKPIPGTDEILSIFSPGHGAREHAGAVTLLTVKRGPDHTGSATRISGNHFRDPYPLSANAFLVATGPELVLMDRKGKTKSLYRLPEDWIKAGATLHEPRPIQPRARERVIPTRREEGQDTGRLILTNANMGRRMDGLKPGEIKKLLVLEVLPMPIHYTGGMDPISYSGTFTLERVLGTIPVEADGSAYMELPALRSFFFVALDKHDNSVKRMQSFLSVMPGETTSCVGCHEHRTSAVKNGNQATPLALTREPSRVTPIPGIPDVFDFPRDIQPVLDKHCASCHNYDQYKGRVILTGDRGPLFSHSYYTLTALKQIADGRDQPVSNLPPKSIGAAASPLMHKILTHHNDVNLSAHEINLVRYWLESGAAYPGTYGALGSGMIGGYYENHQVLTDTEWPGSKEAARKAAKAIQQRCSGCHTGNSILPKTLSDERGVSFWRPDMRDPRLRLARHAVFNLTRPDKSLMLLAPMAKAAGGYGICKTTDTSGDEHPVFSDRDDPDYKAIWALCHAGKLCLEDIKRFDMPGFQPPQPYVREMKRYGVLPEAFDMDHPVDSYTLDQAYWKSLWHQPDQASN